MKFPPFEGPGYPTKHFKYKRVDRSWATATITELAAPPTPEEITSAADQGVGYMQCGFFHNNVYPSGKVSLSTLDSDKGWHPSLTLAEILLSVQYLLKDPNNLDPSQEVPFRLYKYHREWHDERVREQAARYTAQNFEQLVSHYCMRLYGKPPQWTEDGQHRIVIGQGG